MSTQLDVAQFLRLRRLTEVAVTPDGKFAVVVVRSLNEEAQKYVGHLVRVELASGATTELTRGPSDHSSPRFAANGDLFFLSNRNPGATSSEEGHEERRQVWKLSTMGGDAAPITSEPLGVSAFRVSPNGVLAFAADRLPGVPDADQRKRAAEIAKKGPTALHYTASPVRFWDHWLGPAHPHLFVMRDGVVKDLTPEAKTELHNTHFDIGGDGGVVLTTRRGRGADRVTTDDVLAIDTATGAIRVLVSYERAGVETLLASPDGKRVAIERSTRSDGHVDDVTLELADVASGKRVVAEHKLWLKPMAFARDGLSLYAIAEDRCDVRPFRVDLETNAVTAVFTRDVRGTHEAIAVTPDGERIVGLHHSLVSPPELFVASTKSPGERRIVTKLSGFDPASIEGYVTERRSISVTRHADGDDMDVMIVVPPSKVPVPGAVLVHGGPHSQWADGWQWRWNPLLFASAGFACMLPNPRGSSGRGFAFADDVWSNRWDDAYADIMAATDALTRDPRVDGSRVVAAGGSYGGYMVNWIGGHTDRFRALVSHACVWDFGSFFGTTDDPHWFFISMGFAPNQIDSRSPHAFVDRWKSPTLVIHGEKDYRCGVAEGLALFEALQARGIRSELLLYPDEGHWILRPENSRVWYETVLGFLKREVAS